MCFILLVPFLFLISCSHPPAPTPKIKITKGESVNLIEHGYYVTYPLNGKRKNVQFREQLDFIPLFIGSFRELPTLNYYGTYKNLVIDRWFDNPSNIKATVSVDTTRAFRHLPQWDFNTKEGFRQIEKDRTELDWYPVYIENLMTDSIQVGYDLSLELFIEAKDKNGKWRSINQPDPAGCGVGKYQQLLPPNQYVITSVPVYQGSFRTKARLVLYSQEHIYSNEFNISINESQFTLPKAYDDEYNNDYMKTVFYWHNMD